MIYRYVFVAGTFDGIHKGHEAMLRRAFDEGEHITIGLTSNTFVQKFKIFNSQFSINENSMKISNFKLKIRDYKKRKQNLEIWLKTHSFADRTKIIPIDDPYEPAASEKNLDALVVSSQTKLRGKEINTMRVDRGLTELALLVEPIVVTEDGRPVSSTRVRTGEIDGQGRLVMPEALRWQLSQPLGTVLVGEAIARSMDENKNRTHITVGDIATKTFVDKGAHPMLAIIDFHVRRKPYNELASFIQVPNRKIVRLMSGPGFITKEASRAIFSWSKKPQPTTIIVNGEEDLLALPAIQFAPIGSIVYYGQPPIHEGLVEVMISDEIKKKIVAILRKFT